MSATSESTASWYGNATLRVFAYSTKCCMNCICICTAHISRSPVRNSAYFDYLLYAVRVFCSPPNRWKSVRMDLARTRSIHSAHRAAYQCQQRRAVSATSWKKYRDPQMNIDMHVHSRTRGAHELGWSVWFLVHTAAYVTILKCILHTCSAVFYCI
jgi:hypothetical protein